MTDQKRTRMNGILPFLCTGCDHDMDRHVPTDMHQDACMAKLGDGTRCPCDNFRILVSAGTAAAVKAAQDAKNRR